jgi:Raf kinase inhibitor-like YbhB/YbcL family protein
MAVVMSDPDAPGGTFIHWTRWGSGVEGRNSFGKTGYDGPCPPKGDAPHHYVVTVYALRAPLTLARGASPDEVLAAIKKQASASGSQTGTYGR